MCEKCGQSPWVSFLFEHTSMCNCGVTGSNLTPGICSPVTILLHFYLPVQVHYLELPCKRPLLDPLYFIPVHGKQSLSRLIGLYVFWSVDITWLNNPQTNQQVRLPSPARTVRRQQFTVLSGECCYFGYLRSEQFVLYACKYFSSRWVWCGCVYCCGNYMTSKSWLHTHSYIKT